MQSLWMVAAAFLFACMGVCVKLGADHFAAGELVFYRGFVATLILGAIIAWKRLPLATKHAGTHVWRGLAGFVSLVAYFYAITLIPLATAVTLNYTSPLFLALLLVLWVREKPSVRLYLALTVGFIGVVMVLQPTIQRHQWWGGLLGLVSGIVSSIAYLNVRQLGEMGEPEWRTVFYFSLLSTLGAGLWMLFFRFHPLTLRGAGLLLGVGIFATLAQLAMTRAYSRGRTLVAASLAYTAVVFASLFGMLFWGEVLSLAAWLAIVVIVLSGMAATRFSRANPAEQD